MQPGIYAEQKPVIHLYGNILNQTNASSDCCILGFASYVSEEDYYYIGVYHAPR